MAAIYYLGASAGTSKKTGNKFWSVSFLAPKFGQWGEVVKFCESQQQFDDILKMRLISGCPVEVLVGISGNLENVSIDRNAEPLRLPDLQNSD